MDKNEYTSSLTLKDLFLIRINGIINDKILKFILFGMIFSYFYNLPVLKYSIKGDNELRLYDILGFFLLYFYYKYYSIVDVVIINVPFLKILRRFMYWACITMIVTLFFYIINDALTSFLQVILYMYHFWIFYIAAVFFYIFCLNKSIQKTGIYLIVIFSIISCLIVVFQNLGM